jgi:pyocin large subunit-like protein
MSKKQKSSIEDGFEVMCPCCEATLKIDPVTRAVITHTPKPVARTFADMEAAARAMREGDVRKESIFRQSVEAEKNKADLMDKKFAEAVKKAKEEKDLTKPFLRDFDLD